MRMQQHWKTSPTTLSTRWSGGCAQKEGLKRMASFIISMVRLCSHPKKRWLFLLSRHLTKISIKKLCSFKALNNLKVRFLNRNSSLFSNEIVAYKDQRFRNCNFESSLLVRNHLYHSWRNSKLFPINSKRNQMSRCLNGPWLSMWRRRSTISFVKSLKRCATGA